VPFVDAVSEPFWSPSLDEEDELVEERLPVDEELLELELLLELDGMDGIDAVEEDEDELEGEGAREEEDEGEELGMDGEEDDDGEDELLGIDGMLLLLLELCWVDSQPARTRARAEAPTRATARPETRWRKSVVMVASVSFTGAREP
jgi:hypothetical protein